MEWFKQEPDNPNCLRFFMDKCDDETFVHNSVPIVSMFIHANPPDYSNITDCYEQFNSRNGLCKELVQIGESAKKHNYRDNLSILLTNIFMGEIEKNAQGHLF
jgi:hypothetical protein